MVAQPDFGLITLFATYTVKQCIKIIFMKTGKFIESQYEREIARIISEVEIAKQQITAETEILKLQAGLRIHQSHQEGAMVVSLNCGGCIVVQYAKGNGIYLPLCTVHDNPHLKWQKPMVEELSSLHISKLKTIHPKRAVEVVRMLAKKHMLASEPATTTKNTKKWWKLW